MLVQKKTAAQRLATVDAAGSAPSAFARRHLERLGWREGDGLGKDRKGRSEHVKVVKKDDTFGIGAKEAEKQRKLKEISSAWWTHGFEDALSKLKVPNSGKKRNRADSESEDSDSESQSRQDEDAKLSIEMRDLSHYSESDRELFIACRGRRCGKRAGRLQKGKILREHLADQQFKQKLGLVDPKEKAKSFHLAARESMLLKKKNDNASEKEEEKRKKKMNKKKKNKSNKKRKACK